MMLEHIGWTDSAETLRLSFAKTLKENKVTADFASQLKDCKTLSTTEFAKALIENM